MSKRQLTIVIAVLGVIVIGGWLVFFFFVKTPQVPAPATGIPVAQTPVPASPAPTAQQGAPQAQFTKLTDHQVADPEAGTQNVVYFDVTDQLLKVMSLALGSNQENKLLQTAFEGITDARWSPNRQMVVLAATDRDTQSFVSVDLTQNLQYDLPDFVQDPVWSPDGKLIAFYHWNPDAGQAWIATVKSDGTQEKKIVAPGLGENVRLLWPTQDTLLFYEKPLPSEPLSALFTYSFKNGQLAAVTLPTGESSAYGFEVTASPDGTLLLAQFTAENGNALSTYVIQGNRMTELPFQTLVQKCAWAQNSLAVYCAFPATWNVGNNMLPFDYWRGIVSPNDSFARVNVKTGEFTAFASGTAYDATNLSVSPDEIFLTFVNRKDLSLYKMRIR